MSQLFTLPSSQSITLLDISVHNLTKRQGLREPEFSETQKEYTDIDTQPYTRANGNCGPEGVYLESLNILTRN